MDDMCSRQTLQLICAGYQQDTVQGVPRFTFHAIGISINPWTLLKGSIISMRLPIVNLNTLQQDEQSSISLVLAI